MNTDRLAEEALIELSRLQRLTIMREIERIMRELEETEDAHD